MAKERGICIGCGLEKTGFAADEDWVILCARKMRVFFRMKARHTISCASCMQKCELQRGKFEKTRFAHRVAAGLVFIIAFFGSAAYGKLDFWALAASALGAMTIALLPYFSYCPAFSKR